MPSPNSTKITHFYYRPLSGDIYLVSNNGRVFTNVPKLADVICDYPEEALGPAFIKLKVGDHVSFVALNIGYLENSKMDQKDLIYVKWCIETAEKALCPV